MKQYTKKEIFESLEEQLKELTKKVSGETEQEKAVYAITAMENYYKIFKANIFLEVLEDLGMIYIFEPSRTYEIYKKYGICN